MYTVYYDRNGGLYDKKKCVDSAAEAFAFAQKSFIDTGKAACVVADADQRYDIYRVYPDGEYIAPKLAQWWRALNCQRCSGRGRIQTGARIMSCPDCAS
jgi:hypothetical protein